MDGSGLIISIIVIVGIILLVRMQARRAKRARLLVKYGDEKVVDAIIKRSFWQGMTQEMLIDSLGDPADIATRVLKAKTVYTFKYNRTGRNRYGTRIRLENGTVVGWEQK